MRAAVYLGDGSVRIEERPVPRPGPGEVLVAMRACGICGSDLMEWYVARKAPAVLGHEPAGVVVELGAGLEEPQPGTRVFVHHHVPCGECEYCARGRETLCDGFKASRIEPGGFSELILVPERNAALDLLVLPDSVSDEAATLIEPLACCVRGLDRARVDAGTRLLVIGGGQMGLLIAQAALARGATVTVAEPLPARRALAEALGARAVEPDAAAISAPTVDEVASGAPTVVNEAAADVHAAAGGAPGVVNAAAGGAPTAIILTTGAQAAWELALTVADRGAVIQLFAPAAPEQRRAFDVNELFFRELEIQATYSAGPGDTRAALELLASGAVTADGIITHRFPLEQTGAALSMARSREGIKVIVTSS